MALSAIQVAAIRHLTPDPQDRGMTNQQFCDLHGISIKTLEAWQGGVNCPDFKVALLKSKESYQANPNYMMEIARQHAIESLLKDLNSTDPAMVRDARKHLLQETKDLRDTGQSVNYDEYADEELYQMCMDRFGTEEALFKEALSALPKKGAKKK